MPFSFFFFLFLGGGLILRNSSFAFLSKGELETFVLAAPSHPDLAPSPSPKVLMMSWNHPWPSAVATGEQPGQSQTGTSNTPHWNLKKKYEGDGEGFAFQRGLS